MGKDAEREGLREGRTCGILNFWEVRVRKGEREGFHPKVCEMTGDLGTLDDSDGRRMKMNIFVNIVIL